MNTAARVDFHGNYASVAFISDTPSVLADVRQVLSGETLGRMLVTGETNGVGTPLLIAEHVSRSTVIAGLKAMATAGMIPELPDIIPANWQGETLLLPSKVN